MFSFLTWSRLQPAFESRSSVPPLGTSRRVIDLFVARRHHVKIDVAVGVPRERHLDVAVPTSVTFAVSDEHGPTAPAVFATANCGSNWLSGICCGNVSSTLAVL